MTKITGQPDLQRGRVFLLAMFFGAGLAFTGCSGDDTATTPAPPPPAPAPATPAPEPPRPESPAAPTGLMVSATTTDSVTWSWNAVEGAVAYAVQVSLDEMFDDTDAVSITTETSHTQSGLEPETSVYARVATAAGTIEDPVQSAWTTHVTGMSAMPPPPPPPAPDPLMVTFMVPKGKLPLQPDTSTDKARAMAMVNQNIAVASNTTALIEPVKFAEGASSVTLSEGDNLPFKFLEWRALQSQVIEDGVTFKITRTMLGANQEVLQTGDVAYVTCGPFECVAGMDAPAVSIQNSTACADWDPDLRLELGAVDPEGATSPGRARGFDLGWVYTANTAFTVKHDFGNFSASGGEVARGTNVALPAGRPPAGPTATPRRRDITDSPDGASTSARVVLDLDSDPATGNTTDGCLDATGASASPLYQTGRSSLRRPDNCFRLSTAAAYLRNYTVELTPKNAGVSWGSIQWDAFKSLTCEKKTFRAADQLDVCALLEEEVNTLKLRPHPASPSNDPWGAPNTGPVGFTVQALTLTSAPLPGGLKLHGIDLWFTTQQTRWTQLLYFDDTTAADTTDTENLYDIGGLGGGTATARRQENKPGRLTGQGIPGNIHARNRWIHLLDADYLRTTKYGDLGDLGYVDADATNGGDDKPDNFPTRTCTAADGGRARSSSTARDGTLCDAEDVQIRTSVTFTDGMGFGCRVQKSYTVTCDWDSSGGMRVGAGNDLGSSFTRAEDLGDGESWQFAPGSAADFIRCDVAEN